MAAPKAFSSEVGTGSRQENASTQSKSAVDMEALSLRIVFGVLCAIAMVFLIGPTIVVILTSFTPSESLRFPPSGLSLRWYQALLEADQMQAAAWTSLVVAFWTTLISAVFGTAAALAISRSRGAVASTR